MTARLDVRQELTVEQARKTCPLPMRARKRSIELNSARSFANATEFLAGDLHYLSAKAKYDLGREHDK